MFFMLLIGIFILALGITPGIMRFALSHGIIDKPGKDPLKIHSQSVPLCGGLVMGFCLVIGLILFLLKYPIKPNEFKIVSGILSGSILVFFIGLRDDMKGVKPIFRLAIQIFAGFIVLAAGVAINVFPWGLVAILLTLFYIVGAINAFNVIDGMDGLCVGISIISSAGFFLLGLIDGNIILMTLSSLLCLSLMGILSYNFYPAKVFLGDAGSGLLGFLFGVMAVIATSRPFSFTTFFLPLFFIAIPVFDMAFAILRRLFLKKPIFLGDRDHFYDLMLKRGWSQPKVWGIMCTLQALSVVSGFALVKYF